MLILQVIKLHYRKFFQTNWIKTIWFNLTKLPILQGIRIPILVSNYVKIRMPLGGGNFRLSN